MKSIIIPGLCLMFLSCGPQNGKRESLLADSTREKNAFSDAPGINATTVDQVDEIGSPYQQELNRALADSSIDDYYKEIYRQEELVPAEDSKMLSIREKLFTDDSDKDLFFFIVFTKSLNGSDGFYSEAAGLSAFEFVTKRTEWFADYFSVAPKLNDRDMENWAKYVYGEIKISRENEETEAVQELEAQLYENIKIARGEYHAVIEEFMAKVKRAML